MISNGCKELTLTFAFFYLHLENPSPFAWAGLRNLFGQPELQDALVYERTKLWCEPHDSVRALKRADAHIDSFRGLLQCNAMRLARRLAVAIPS